MRFVYFVLEWVLSCSLGVITALLCQAMQLNPLLVYAMTGVAGHIGGRYLFIRKLRKELNNGQNNYTLF